MTKAVYEMHGLDHGHLFRDVIDTMSLARLFLVPLGLKRVSLRACMEFIGEGYEDAHNAHADAVYCEKLYNFIMGNLKWHGKQEGKRIQEQLF
jgi:DNA polymerase III epsilon subunit-like protein